VLDHAVGPVHRLEPVHFVVLVGDSA